MNGADLQQFMWPLTAILIALLLFRQLRTDTSPIIKSVVSGLSQSAAKNATQYAIAIGFGLSASLSAFYDVFNNLTQADVHAMSWHGYAALWTKVLNPFIVAILAYATQSNSKAPGWTKPGETNPPFTQPQSRPPL